MPSKKRKYNARFPAGRIKKIMQTDEEVGKVAQAVPIIIFLPTPRTLELFVESLLSKALQVTMSRNAKTLSPSHVKQCILAESRFDFLQDLVKNIPDVSAAEEKEMMSAENSPNSSRFSEIPVPPRRIAREDSSSSSSSDLRGQAIPATRDGLRRGQSTETDSRPIKTETATSTIVSGEEAIDLSRKTTETETKQVRTANFYQETLILKEDVQHKSVITPNPTYATPQPSTSNYAILKPVEPLQRIPIPLPKIPEVPFLSPNLRPLNNNVSVPKTPVTPIINIDFSKSLEMPEIKVLDSSAVVVNTEVKAPNRFLPILRQNSKSHKTVESRRVDIKPSVSTPSLINVDIFNSGNLQIDEDYDT